jgi:hypothetical protein
MDESHLIEVKVLEQKVARYEHYLRGIAGGYDADFIGGELEPPKRATRRRMKEMATIALQCRRAEDS